MKSHLIKEKLKSDIASHHLIIVVCNSLDSRDYIENLSDIIYENPRIIILKELHRPLNSQLHRIIVVLLVFLCKYISYSTPK